MRAISCFVYTIHVVVNHPAAYLFALQRQFSCKWFPFSLSFQVVPCTGELVKESKCGCRSCDVLQMERIILVKLSWNIQSSTALDYLHIVSDVLFYELNLIIFFIFAAFARWQFSWSYCLRLLVTVCKTKSQWYRPINYNSSRYTLKRHRKT